MRLPNCFLAAVALLVVFAGPARADQQPPGVFCQPQTWTPNATPPTTGWCMWYPNIYAYTLPPSVSVCDQRWIPTGSVDIFDKPFVGNVVPPYGMTNCARLNLAGGGLFTFADFQRYGWQANTNPGLAVIRSMVVGPNTSVMWSDRPFVAAPQYCAPVPAKCFNTTSGLATTEGFWDLWQTSGPSFAMATLRVYPPSP